MKIQVKWGLGWEEAEALSHKGTTVTAQVTDRLGRKITVKFKNTKRNTTWLPRGLPPNEKS